MLIPNHKHHYERKLNQEGLTCVFLFSYFENDNIVLIDFFEVPLEISDLELKPKHLFPP